MPKQVQQVEPENPILEWFKRDAKLCDIVNAITSKNLSLDESARLAFYEVADYLQVPKQPEDITEEIFRAFDDLDIEPESVFEQMAIINYLADETDDIRGLVMQALYNVHFKQYFTLDSAAAIFYGSAKKIPAKYSCRFFGVDIDARLEFETGQYSNTDLNYRIRKQVG